MAEAAGVHFRIHFDALPWLPGALGYAEAWVFAGGAHNNHAFYDPLITYTDLCSTGRKRSCTIRRRPAGCWFAVTRTSGCLLAFCADAINRRGHRRCGGGCGD